MLRNLDQLFPYAHLTAYLDAMGENNTPTALKGCWVKICKIHSLFFQCILFLIALPSRSKKNGGGGGGGGGTVTSDVTKFSLNSFLKTSSILLHYMGINSKDKYKTYWFDQMAHWPISHFDLSLHLHFHEFKYYIWQHWVWAPFDWRCWILSSGEMWKHH